MYNEIAHVQTSPHGNSVSASGIFGFQKTDGGTKYLGSVGSPKKIVLCRKETKIGAAYTLSGGERRRTEIARALAVEPKFLLLDEPFAGIDPIAVSDIKSMVRTLTERDIGVLITDHNVRDTLEITDRAIIISSGQIVAQGTKEDILESPIARKIYLGEEFRM